MSIARHAAFQLLFTTMLVLVLALSAWPQTSTSGSVVGIVTDPSGAVVAKAAATLVNLDTNATLSMTSNAQGEFVFPNVAPGPYRLTVTASGFRTADFRNVTVEVNKSVHVPVQMEVGSASETIEVHGIAGLELQTTDAQLGNVIPRESINKLALFQRDAVELLKLQPGVSNNGGTLTGMRVTGAIDDQNTVKLDGIDITANVVASRTVIPTPTYAVEEFRVGVSNPTQELGRSSGGQVTMVGRHGTNTMHANVNWSHQNSALNANTWENNFAHVVKPPLKDNRFGGSVGGPIFKDKTFFFGIYDGRRFRRVFQVQRTVPLDSLRSGVLRFRDSNNNVQSINLATAAICGPTGTAPCDPRGLGISPYTKAFWALMPEPNITGGDGLNTGAFLANFGAPINSDFGTFRLDHNFSDKLKFSGTYAYFRNLQTGTGQVDIRNGNAQSAILNPQRGVLASGVLSWQIRPNFLNTFRYGWVWNRNSANATTPTAAAQMLALPGTNSSGGGCSGTCAVAVLPASNQSNVNLGGFLDSPIDMDTQRARFQSDNDKDIQYIDDVSWLHGNHSVQFGGQLNHLPYTHMRADKVIGSLSSLVATMDSGPGFTLTIPAVNTPPTCSTTVPTNCVRAADLTNYGRFYAATLGLLDNVSILAMRDGNLNPLPFGTLLTNITKQNVYYFYAQDSWRIFPSFTLTYGLAYGWNTPPKEDLDRQTIQIDAATGQPLDAQSYLNQKAQAALSGTIFNPTFGFQPVRNAHRSVFDTDYGDWAPRVAFAWNPSDNVPLVGRFLGSRKTAIRGGFAMVYDRSNTVQSVEIPMLGIGFDQNINVTTPLCNYNGTSVAGCDAAATLTNPGAASFRVGVDGNIPIPSVPAVGNPVVPPLGTNATDGFTETLSFQVDPKLKIGRSYNIDLGFQRELPGNMVLEASYAGRFARRLPQAVNLNASPYFFVDTASGQSFARAFDAVAAQLRSGVPAASVTPQPWFENQLAGASTTTSQTAALLNGVRGVAGQSNNFVLGNVSSIFQNMGKIRRVLGRQAYNDDQTQVAFMRTYIGQSNYNGLLVSLRKRSSYGLQFAVNYTFARTLDDNLSNQNNAGFYSNSFHPGVDYGVSTFDRTHVLNANYVYDLPAGRGHTLFSHGVLDKIFGGWYNSSIFQWDSALPFFVSQGVNAWGGGLILAPTSNAVTVNGSLPGTGVNNGVTGSNSIGTTANPNPPAGTPAGTGKDIFADPAAAYAMFRRLLIGTDTRTGKGQPMRGIGYWNLDTTLGKDTSLTERVKMRFSFDFFNIFNHPNFTTPTTNTSITGQPSFGVITSTQTLPDRTNSARWIQFGMQVIF